MQPATVQRNRRATRTALLALLGCTLLVATVTFVLSFAGLDDYGRRVAQLGNLSPLVPVGVDGLTLCAVAATFLLRNAAWRPRAYAWLVFGVAVGASVAGNLSHAAARSLAPDGMVGAAAWPLLLTLAAHMVIVVLRHMDNEPVAEPTQVHNRQDASAAVQPQPARPVQPMRAAASNSKRHEGLRLIAAGESDAAVALAIGVNKSTVGRWRKKSTQPQDRNVV